MPERDLDPNLIPSLGSHPWERGTPELRPSGLPALGTSSKDACSEQACGSGLTLTAATSARMKRPLSPSHSPENGVRLVEVAGCPPSQPEQRMKREKKHQSFTLCEVCNIQLNSAAQAQIHYNGKSHQKRLKQLNKGKMPAVQGPSGHSSPLLASLPIPGRPLHPPLDIKHFLTFRLNGTSPLNLFPNFNTMDPVQKAVISHTFGVPAPLKKKQFISSQASCFGLPRGGCTHPDAAPWPGWLCLLWRCRPSLAKLYQQSLGLGAALPAKNQAEAHYKGHKHARRLKAIEAMKNKQKVVGAAAVATGRDGTADFAPSPEGSGEPGSTAPADGLQEPEGECSSLGLTPSAEEPPESGSSVSSAPESEKEGKKSKQHLYCPTCKVTVNSLSQLEAHNT
ncbi:zinc finger protein 385B-like, partial [Egretta garzetta]|uniref:zinc finger protein 385B-like n=1 Tax=Egretta garzetta TaxID=188379 RepID=UPI00163C9673